MAQFKDIEKVVRKYPTIIIDLDGTLVNLNVDWRETKNKLYKFCIKNKKEPINFSILENGLMVAKKKYGKKFYSKLLDIVSSYEMDEEKYEINTYLINYLNSNNSMYIIYSMNTQKTINNFITRYLKNSPREIIAKETCLEQKPTDKDLNNLMHKFKLNKKEMVFIGNSVEDLRSGKLAGVKTYLINI